MAGLQVDKAEREGGKKGNRQRFEAVYMDVVWQQEAEIGVQQDSCPEMTEQRQYPNQEEKKS